MSSPVDPLPPMLPGLPVQNLDALPSTSAAMPEAGYGAADNLQTGGIEILDEYLAARIQLLEERSPRFRAAMALARVTPIRVILGTPDQVHHHLALLVPRGEKPASDRLGDIVIQRCKMDSPSIQMIVVRIYLARLRSAAWQHAPFSRRRSRRWLDSMTDAILIHELWGHLIPLLEAGDYTGRCSDPAPGQPELESCVMQRENDLRRELGLEPRERYSIHLPGT